ncbi:NUDIX domain-containing protein [Thermoproteota archaeon]
MMAEVNRASCLILNSGKILLVKDKKVKCWSLPGGAVATDETEEDIAAKNTEEKTGIPARIIQLFGIYEYQKEGKNYAENVFEADIPEDKNEEAKPHPDFEAKWFDVSSAKKKDVCPELKLVFEDI